MPELGQAKIKQSKATVRHETNVVWLEVAMEDAAARETAGMAVVQRLGELLGNAQRTRERPARGEAQFSSAEHRNSLLLWHRYRREGREARGGLGCRGRRLPFLDLCATGPKWHGVCGFWQLC